MIAKRPCDKCGANEYRWADSNHVRVRCPCGAEYLVHPQVAFTHQDDMFIGAVELGCTPVYTGASWECRCPAAIHAISTTCAIVTSNSLERFKAETA